MGKKNKKSWILTLIIVFILIMSIGGGFFLISYVNRVSIDTNHIYMIGSVRGNIQRLVKLELSGSENQSIISEIDEKMDYIEENKDFIYNNDKTRLEYVDRMLREWRTLKSYLKTYDINKSNYIKHIIIIRSESIWTTADNMISLSQIATENQISRINDAYYVILLNLISGLLLLVIIRKYVKENLEYNIERDPLTNLYNRRYFSHVLRFEIDRCNRYGNKLSVIMFDIDNFKGINDKFGHDIGDNVLIELGNLIKKNIRSTDTLSRLGGEEFVIIATETEIEDAVKVANKVRTIISEHQFKIVGNVTVSIGITEFKNKDTFNSIYKRADNALYRAKNKGKNTCEIIKVNE